MAAAKVKLQPIGGNVLVKPDEIESTTASGLVIAASAKGEKPQRGTVVALGTGKLNDKGEKIPFNVAIGDIVIFKKYAPDEVEVDGDGYLIMEEQDILAVAG
jgi:chaperonin GroES